MNYQDAQRQNIPMPIIVAGVSGSGKTFSSLLLAAGLAGPNGKVGMIDTENRRGTLYADVPEIIAAMPHKQPFKHYDLRAPFSPERYAEAIDKALDDRITTLVIDSFTHEWEGDGGCQDIAEKHKLRNMPNWARAKREHKTLVNKILACPMHIILCLRAREKSRPIKGSNEFEQLGVQPICEKNLVFEALLSLMIDEGTHLARPLKVPHPLVKHFPASGAMVTKQMGEAIRVWAEGGAKPTDNTASLTDSAEAFARQGVESFRDFWKTITPAQRTSLKDRLEEFQEIANTADQLREAEDRGEFAEASPSLTE